MNDDDVDLRYFGSRRPGSSERVLERARGGELNPFDWLARSVSESAGRVLDLASATGALSRRLSREGRTVIGVDLSGANVAEARDKGGAEYVQADIRYLPFAENSFDAVVSSLGLGVVENRGRFLEEAARVLRPGGVFAALTPSLRPLNVEELRISSQLGRYLRFPPQLPGLAEFRAKRALESVGLTKVEDSRARYHFRISSRRDAEMLLAGLRQAPDKARTTAAVEFLALKAQDGPFTIPLPMRRIVAIK